MEIHPTTTHIEQLFQNVASFLFRFIPRSWIPVLLSTQALVLEILKDGAKQANRTKQFITDSFAEEELHFLDPEVSRLPFVFRQNRSNPFGTPKPLWAYNPLNETLVHTSRDDKPTKSLPFLAGSLFEEDHHGNLSLIGEWGEWCENLTTNQRTEIPWTILISCWAWKHNIELPLYEKVQRLHVVQEDASELWVCIDHGVSRIVDDDADSLPTIPEEAEEGAESAEGSEKEE